MGSTPLSFGLSSTSTGAMPSVRSFRTAAWPSLPRPQTPTRAHPGKHCAGRTSRASALAASWFHEGVAGRDEARPHRVPHGLDLRLGRRVGRPVTSAASSCSSVVSARSCLLAASMTAARHSLTSPTHSNGLVPEPRRVWNFGFSSGLSSGSGCRGIAPAAGREYRPELFRRHERGQDQVDEAALVALAAPVVEAAAGVDVKGPVTAAERAVVLRQVREPLAHPQLGPVAERGEVVGQARRDRP